MASVYQPQPPLQPPQQSLDLVIRELVNAYGYSSPLVAGNKEECLQVYGHCLLKANQQISQYAQQLNLLQSQNQTHQLPQSSDGPSQDPESYAISPPDFVSHSSSVQELHEQVSDLISRVDKVENDEPGLSLKISDLTYDVEVVDKRLGIIEEEHNGLSDQLTEVESNLDKRLADVEVGQQKLSDRIDRVEHKLEELGDRIDKVEQKLSDRIDRVEHKLEGLSARSRNGITCRFYEMVTPIKQVFNPETQRIELQALTGPKNVGYYWKMHKSKYYKRLQAEHEFYGISYRNWAKDDGFSDTEDEDGDDDLSLPPRSLAEAIARYPDKAVMALFSELGLVYSTFREQTVQCKRREEEALKKRPKMPSKALPPAKIRSKATSSTKSFDNGSLDSVMLLSP